MKFIRDLLGRKKRNADAPKSRETVESLEQSYRDTIGSIVEDNEGASVSDILTDVAQKTSTATEERVIKPEETPAVNIWDLEDDGTSTELPMTAPELPTPAPAPAPAAAASAAARSPSRSRRTKTRLIGFEKSDGDVVDLFNDAPRAAPVKSVKFPVGWIVVAEGPGRGESFSLMAGMSQIGRGEDQAVQLDFGDNSISRTNHAAIVYDADSKEFLLGHGGKSNIVRLNDKPLISNEALKSGDVIRIGETVLRFVALCDQTFSWDDNASGEDEDVAIA
ncbi:FHA domain-containing protein [Cognatiyoonia sp. IB215182]|uniref:FHA domain-containing protein n=1 Tax=Cognatiyoonia sp. IB215182 TaxID=3097353 RepID=UPI002A132EBD|nr:FHA domain-containing protein [Cognatiyoonia sp. IB215182]MDX8352636.1 FHA domain-containing protein [Cognatiyoonia sp. IB215182]